MIPQESKSKYVNWNILVLLGSTCMQHVVGRRENVVLLAPCVVENSQKRADREMDYTGTLHKTVRKKNTVNTVGVPLREFYFLSQLHFHHHSQSNTHHTYDRD